MNENQLDAVLDAYANAILTHIKDGVKGDFKLTKTSLYALLEELKADKGGIDDGEYEIARVSAIESIDNAHEMQESISAIQPLAIELVNYGTLEQKARLVDIIANHEGLQGLDYTCQGAPMILDGNITFDV